jgi:hypothetical protein
MMTSRYHLDLRPLQEAATDRSPPAMVAALVMLRISGITFWTLLILSERHLMARRAAGSRNTRLPSSVPSVLSDSQERTTYALTSERTRMSDRSFARSAAKHSLVNTTANATKVCTLARRNSCVVALFRVPRTGAVVADLLAQMPWVGTSGRRQVVFASNPYWTKRLLNGRRPGSKNSSRHKLPQGWWHRSRCWPSRTWT